MINRGQLVRWSLLIIVIITVIAIGTSFAFADDNDDFAGGDGSIENPYQIANTLQLDKIREYPDANFVLVNDIVFDDSDFEEGGAFYNHEAIDYKWGYYSGYNENNNCDPLESGWVPIVGFRGTLDGQNHCIKNITLVRYSSTVSNYFGFIGDNNGTIENLFFEDVFYKAGSSLGTIVGGIAAENNGSIYNCVVSGSIKAFAGDIKVGGIAGINNGEIKGCVSFVNSSCSKGSNSGGVAGITSDNNGSIYDCVNFGKLSACSQFCKVSGISSYNNISGIIDSSYCATDLVSPQLSNVSSFGICGYNSGTIINSYVYSQKPCDLCEDDPNSNIAKIEGCGYIDNKVLLSKEGYPGFDFNEDWVINSNSLPMPKDNEIVLSLKTDFNYLFNKINNFHAQPNSYKSIVIKWDKVESCDHYVLYYYVDKSNYWEYDDYGKIPQEDKGIYGILAVLDKEETQFIHEVTADDLCNYSYSIAPVWEMDGVYVEGLYSPTSSSYKVDTNGQYITPSDTIAPEISNFSVSKNEVYAPGSIEANIEAFDNTGIASIALQLKEIGGSNTIYLSRDLHDQYSCSGPMSFSIESGTKKGKYYLYGLTIIDSNGNKNCYSCAYYDKNNIIELKEEFDIEFEGKLSVDSIPNELANMDEGKTVVLINDTASGGILKKQCLDAIKGQDKTIVVYADPNASLQWVFYGKDIEGETKDLNLNVYLEIVDGQEYGTTGNIIRVVFDDNGQLPGIVNFRLKSDYVESMYNLSGSIYVYYENGGGLSLESSNCPVVKDGSDYWVYFDLSHNSKFIISGEELHKGNVTRIFGPSRYETAIKAADAYKAQLGVDKFDAVIIACGTNYADALAGSYLSNVKKAPILLVRNKDQEINLVKEYIKANVKSGGMIYMLGGTSVVPDAAIVGLDSFNSKRLWGTDRYATNLAILKEAGISGDEILVASGTGFADSLSASATGKPILLVKNNIQDSQKAYIESLKGKKFYIIGGNGAVNSDIETYLKNLGTTKRLGGDTRYHTSVKVAREFFPNPKAAVLAYGVNFPDGLCGGSVANAMGGPLLLATSGKADQAAAYAKEKDIKDGAVLGGPTLINDASVKAIFN